jgi:hypothetical protein
VDDVGEDMIVECIGAGCEGHEVTPLLLVGREGLQGDHDHRLNVLDVCNLSV